MPNSALATAIKNNHRKQAWTAYVSWANVPEWEKQGWQKSEGDMEGRSPYLHQEFGCVMIWPHDDPPPGAE